MGNVIDPTYLPFSRAQLSPHFTADADRQIDAFERSATRYRGFRRQHRNLTGISLSSAKVPRQIEKDETFWTAASLTALYRHPQSKPLLATLLRQLYGKTPPIKGLSSWERCLDGDLYLYFEAQLPSPQSYVAWLTAHLTEQQLIPYVRDAADRKSGKPLEGATHVDAILVNPQNGFGVLIEAKVLSDISAYTSFDNRRNQLVRNVDVMLERYADASVISQRRPDRSLLAILTPDVFKQHPRSRLYGWLLPDYQENSRSLARDLPHRSNMDWSGVSKRLGWLTFEMVEKVCPGACPWLTDPA